MPRFVTAKVNVTAAPAQPVTVPLSVPFAMLRQSLLFTVGLTGPRVSLVQSPAVAVPVKEGLRAPISPAIAPPELVVTVPDMSAAEQMTVSAPAVNLVSPALPVIELPTATAVPFSVRVAAEAIGAMTKAAKAAIAIQAIMSFLCI